MSLIPTFNTARLVIRELIESDIPAIQKHFNNYEVIRNLSSYVPWPYPENGARDFFYSEVAPNQAKGRWYWAITLKHSPDELIGMVELLRKASPANRGFWLAEPYWGNGYMTEAIEVINKYAFNHLGFEKLIFSNAVGNTASARIKEKTGAVFIRREPASYVDPRFTEREIYELYPNSRK
jgi:RimJ/RimL family protein N-acetyltransferase